LDKFFYNVPLEYNKKALMHSCENAKSWPYYSIDGGTTDLNVAYDILWPMNIEALRIKNMLLATTNWSFSYVTPGHETGWHTDSTRGATLIVPVNNEPHLIKFKDDTNIIEHYYSTPILTNAKYLHNGINHTALPRYNLLFHFEDSYESICKKIDNNQLFNKWLQYYKYYIDTELDLSPYFLCNCDINEADFIITDKNIRYPEKTIFIGETVENTYSSIVINNNIDTYDIYLLIKIITEMPTPLKRVEI